MSYHHHESLLNKTYETALELTRAKVDLPGPLADLIPVLALVNTVDTYHQRLNEDPNPQYQAEGLSVLKTWHKQKIIALKLAPEVVV